MITTNSYIIENSDNKVLYRGLKLAESKSNVSYEFYKKGKEIIVDAQVKGAGNKTYTVPLTIKLNGVNEIVSTKSNCTCPYKSNFLGLCEHEAAVILSVMEEINNSPNVLTKNYSKKNTTDIKGNTFETDLKLQENLKQKKYSVDVSDVPLNDKSIELIPEMFVDISSDVDSENLYIKLKVKAGRSYTIKNLCKFSHAVYNKEFFEYGKYLAFNHDVGLFNEDSQKLFWIVYENYCEITNQAASSQEMYLSLNNLTRLLDIYLNKTISFEENEINVIEKDPKINVDIKSITDKQWAESEKTSNFKTKNFTGDIIGANIESQTYSVLGQGKIAWLYRENTIYKCSEYFTQNVLPALVKLNIAEPLSTNDNWDITDYAGHANRYYSDVHGGQYHAQLSRSDFTNFAQSILPTLDQNNLITSNDIDFNQYKPIEPEFIFYLSYAWEYDSYMIECVVKYGETEYQIGKFGSEYRHTKREHEVHNVVKKYFHSLTILERKKYQNYKHLKANTFIVNTKDEIFNLFNSGLNEISYYGDIVYEDNFKWIEIKETPDITIDVDMKNESINLNAYSSEVSDTEILNILKHYNLEKEYFINKNNEYVYIDKGKLDTLDKLVQIINNKNIKSLKDIKLPKYRALYINELLTNHDINIRFKRNDTFKETVKNLKNFKDDNIDIPKNINASLRTYQKQGFRWMAALNEAKLGGILADDMGLGKTLQTITLISYIVDKQKGKSPKFLIVCPASLVYNWNDEFEKFNNTIKTNLIIGSAPERKALIKKNATVFITSYSSLIRDVELFKKIDFELCILDEAQYIKNNNSKISKVVKVINSKNKFALSGTPVENSLKDLWSIFDFLMPGYLYSNREFTQKFITPIKHENSKKLEELKTFVAPFILRRHKSDVLQELPDKVENIQYVDLYKNQRKLYDAHVILLKKEVLLTTEGEFKTKAIKYFSMLTKLRQICCSPLLLSDNLKLKPEDAISSKIDTTIYNIMDCIENNHKVLVFSQFTSMLELLIKYYTKNVSTTRYLYLCGSHTKEQRRSMVEKFQNGGADVFFISLKAGGTGLNLTAADRVIHVDPWWNFAAERQATDRTHRIGQKNSVYVTKLVAKNTIEEKIIAIQNSKKELSESVVDAPESSSFKFTKERLLELLS